MKRIGIIGGIGPASTVEYYRLLIQRFRQQLATDHYPEILLHSIDMTEMLGYISEQRFEELIEFLRARIKVLERAGATTVALASNTPHLVFGEVASRVGVEMISIVEETCEVIVNSGLTRVGLLGTKFTMSQGFYQRVGAPQGIDIVTPGPDDQETVHQKYMGELVFHQIHPETKERLLQIVEEMRATQRIEGIILGGTELPLILEPDDFHEIQVFNTTEIHVDAILGRMIH